VCRNTIQPKLWKHTKVWPHRRRAAVAGSDLCPRREGVRTVLCKTASSPSNRRRADKADQSRLRRATDICVLETDLSGGKYRMVGRIKWKINWKSVGVCILVQYGDIRPCVPSSQWSRASTTVIFFFYNSVLTAEEVLPHRNWTSWIKEK